MTKLITIIVISLVIFLAFLRNAHASVVVVVNGTNYTIPQTNEKGWGTNVTSWIQAITANTLQPSGGTFTLGADVDFGASFGLKTSYVRSRALNPATAGILRLGNTESIGWRNFANTANLLLTVDASNILNYNGTPLLLGTVAIANGGTGQTTQQAALNALTGAQSSGKYLRSDGTNTALATIVAGDVPTLNQSTTGTASNITGVAAIVNGGTNNASLAVTAGGAIYTDGSKLVNVGAGTSGQVLKSNGASAPSWGTNTITLINPTVQKFTSGSGTYTTPTSPAPIYLRVRMVGAGGGGQGSGSSSSGGNGGAGGNTTFGSSLLVANGGGGGQALSSSGGTASLGTGPIGVASQGGGGNARSDQQAGINIAGPMGGTTPFGGAGPGNVAAAGQAAVANSGSGGGGAGMGSGIAGSIGGSGAAGGFVDSIITSPLATYAYAIGAAGTAGTAGTSGFAGGAGGSALIIVEEYYQ